VGRFGSTSIGVVAGIIFTLLLLAACISDVRSRRIPNRVVAALGIAGMTYVLAVMPPLPALRHTLGGGATALAVWLPFWLARVLGAGDVKLAAAAGVWLGARGVVEASLIGAAAGGILALLSLSRGGGLRTGISRFGAWMVASRALKTVMPELTPRERRIPYGLAIAAGATVAAWVPGLIL
jgi:prepilin peptidase CpaA